MKVLLNSYNTIMQSKAGGAQERLKCLVSEIRKQGIEIKLFDAFHDKLEDYDILHIYHLDTENVALIDGAKRLGKKVIISSIVNTTGGLSHTFHRLIEALPIHTVYKMYKRALSMADLIISETNAEKNHIARYFCIDEKKIIVIPNGAYRYEKSSEIFEICGINMGTRYVLQVGRFDTNKNQLRMIQALKGTDIQLVFMGGADENDPYYIACQQEAKDFNNIHFLGWVNNETQLFRSAYANAAVLAAPSFYETFGLTIVEGAVNGAKIAVSNCLPILEYPEFRDAITFDPSNVEDIREKIQLAMSLPINDFSRHIAEVYSWDKIAEEHCKWYIRLCEK